MLVTCYRLMMWRSKREKRFITFIINHNSESKLGEVF